MRLKKDINKATKISDLFAKYKNTLQAPEKTVIDCFREVVEDVVGLSIPPQAVKYAVHSQTLSVNVRGVFKSEIQLHKKEILTHMKGRIGEKNAPKNII